MSYEKHEPKQKFGMDMGVITLSLSLGMALALTAPELRAQDTLIVKVSLRTTDFSFETQDGYDDLNVPASLLSTGTYFLRLESKAKAKTEKIIKGGN